MESPYNRPVAANLIREVLNQVLEVGFAGFSLEMRIYTALKDAGYLTESAMVPDKD